MTNFKTRVVYYLGLGLVIFSLPIIIAIIVSPYLFPNSFVSDTVRLLPLEEYQDETQLDSSPKVISVNSGASYARVASDLKLDPEKDRNFLVSFLVRFDAFPLERNRHNILTKYEAEIKPYPGWSIAVGNFGTSLRPQVYWRSADGSGGWHSFDDIELTTKRWYSFSLIVSSDNSMVCLLYTSPSPRDATLSRMPSSA